MTRWIRLSLLIGIILTTGTVAAQTTTATPTPPSKSTAPTRSNTRPSKQGALDSSHQQTPATSPETPLTTAEGKGQVIGNKVGNVLALLAVALGIRKPSAQTPNRGVFDKLSPDNRKTAAALFEAQNRVGNSGKTKSLTRDDIAAMKQSGKRWNEIFQEMKAQGLVGEKTLGQVVSKYTRHQQGPASGAK